MKSYEQYCPIARSLSLVGERWSLLIVRELFYGPKRYTDLVDNLPGIGTNILATRLKELESNGLVSKRKLPPPAASTVYTLTAQGQLLRPVLHELARFGAKLLGPPPPDALGPGWLQHALDLGIGPVSGRGRCSLGAQLIRWTSTGGQPGAAAARGLPPDDAGRARGRGQDPAGDSGGHGRGAVVPRANCGR